MCIREDVGREAYEIIEAEKDDRFTVTMKFTANPELLCRVKAVIGTPPTYQVGFVSTSGEIDVEGGSFGSPKKYQQVLDSINATYRL